MTDLPQTYSADEVCDAFALTRDALDKLIRDGKVGYYVGKRAKRFLPEHIQQLRAAIEVKPQPEVDALSLIGVTRRGVSRRRAS